jgi:S1-C subfamily serine protease
MIRRFAFPLFLGLLIGAGWVVHAHAQQGLTVQETNLRAKPAAVLIISEVSAEVSLNCGGGVQTITPPSFKETGTGWFIDPSGWVITNGHVVQPAHETPRWVVNQMAQRAVTTACLEGALKLAGLQPGDRPDQEDALKRRLLEKVLPTVKVTIKPQISVKLSSGLRLKAEVKKYSAPASAEVGAPSGRDLALLKVPDGNYPALPLSDATVQIGDPIRILGFPGVVLSHELLNESASVDASVTTGAISGLKQDKAGHPFLQTDASAAWGNSGGPAINPKAELVGVLTFVSLAPGAEGAIVQGFNFAIPVQTVKNFVADTPVKINQQGKFNQAWFAGLHDFFTEGDWKGAKRKFGEADKIQPGLLDVKRMLDDATEKVKNPPPKPFPWFWVTIGVTLLSAGGYGAQVGLRWQKNRYRVGPSEVIRLAESGKPPIILDTRLEKQYEQNPIKIHGSIRLSPEELKNGGVASLELDTTRPVVAYCT